MPLRPLRGVLNHLWIGWEYETRVRRIVHLMKFEGRPELARTLIEEWLRVIPRAERLQDFDLLLPVPIHPARRRERGFNQSDLLARELGNVLDLPVAEQDAMRVIHTPSQTLLDRKERWHSVAAAFQLRRPEFFQRRRILLVDDLATSGATLHALATLLRRGGAAAVGGAVLTSPVGLDSQS
jgi:ComF family protein